MPAITDRGFAFEPKPAVPVRREFGKRSRSFELNSMRVPACVTNLTKATEIVFAARDHITGTSSSHFLRWDAVYDAREGDTP